MRFLPIVLLAACIAVDDSSALSCGPGTHQQGGLCVADDTDTDTGSADTGDEDTDTGGDTDTGTDTGGDTDTGTDTGGDTDTGTPADWTVCAAGGAPYTEIQDAVDAAAEGDVITVCAGTYDYVEIYRAELTLVGEDRDTTIITGGSHTALFVDTTSLELSGFTLTGDARATANGAALHLVDTTGTVSDIRIADSTGSYILWQEASEVTWSRVLVEDNAGSIFTAYAGGSFVFRHSVFRNNRSNSGSGGSLFYVSGLDYEVSNNLFYDNEIASNAEGSSFGEPASAGWVYNNLWWRNDHHGAQYLVSAYSGVLLENNIVAETTGGGFLAYTPRDGLQYNAAYNNSGDDFARNDGGGVPSGNLGDDCRLTDPEGGDFGLMAGFSPCIDAGNPLSGYNDADSTPNDLGAFGGPNGAWTPP